MIPKSGNRFSEKIMLKEKAMFTNPLTERLADFVRNIGIDVRTGSLPAKTFLPGLDIQFGTVVVDEQRLSNPGDILHEAGHIAVSDPATRSTPTLSPTDGEEIATLAWSYAALTFLGLDPAVVFHPDGYKGGSASLIENFTAGRMIGVPLLQYFGMTLEPRQAAEQGIEPFPHMLRWLRA
jgi:hypothetical protein